MNYGLEKLHMNSNEPHLELSKVLEVLLFGTHPQQKHGVIITLRRGLLPSSTNFQECQLKYWFDNQSQFGSLLSNKDTQVKSFLIILVIFKFLRGLG